MPTTNLYESLHWETVELPGTSVHGGTHISVGTVGRGGPRATIVAGVHGDEAPWGALAIRSLLERPRSELAGSLRVILAANPLAAEADERYARLDHLDLDRTFPGAPDGSHTERLADALARQVRDSDVVIDLHGGGSWCVNAFVFRFEGSEQLADLVDAPYAFTARPHPGQLVDYASRESARVVQVEMGGRSREESAWRERIATSLTRILDSAGVLHAKGLDAQRAAPVHVSDLAVLRPRAGGLLEPLVHEDRIESPVPEGTELGRLLDFRTLEPIETIRAPFPSTAILLLRPHICAIHGGDMGYVVARLPDRSG